MLNFVLIAKILEMNQMTPENIEKSLKDLAEMVNHKFNVMFLIFINDNVDDEAMAKFAEIVEEVDTLDQNSIQKYREWTEKNMRNLDYNEFLEKFDKEMESIEMQFVNRLKKNLNDEQKKELIDLLQDQMEYEREADEEFDQVLEEEMKNREKLSKIQEEKGISPALQSSDLGSNFQQDQA